MTDDTIDAGREDEPKHDLAAVAATVECLAAVLPILRELARRAADADIHRD